MTIENEPMKIKMTTDAGQDVVFDDTDFDSDLEKTVSTKGNTKKALVLGGLLVLGGGLAFSFMGGSANHGVSASTTSPAPFVADSGFDPLATSLSNVETENVVEDIAVADLVPVPDAVGLFGEGDAQLTENATTGEGLDVALQNATSTETNDQALEDPFANLTIDQIPVAALENVAPEAINTLAKNDENTQDDLIRDLVATSDVESSGADGSSVDTLTAAEVMAAKLDDTGNVESHSISSAPLVSAVEIKDSDTAVDVMAKDAMDKDLMERKVDAPAVPAVALGTSLPNAKTEPVQAQAQRALKEIEVKALVREKPENFYILKASNSQSNRNRDMIAARRALKEGRNQKALDIFERLYETGPYNLSVLIGRAVALQRLNRIDQALTVYEQILREDSRNIEALTNMLGLLSHQDPAYAVSKLQALQKRYPSNVGVNVQLGLAYGDAGYIREAIDILSKAFQTDSGNPSIAYNLAVMYDRGVDPVNAAIMYRRALVLERNTGNRGTIPVEAIHQRLAMF